MRPSRTPSARAAAMFALIIPLDPQPVAHQCARIGLERRTLALDVISAGAERVDVVGNADGGPNILISEQNRSSFTFEGEQFGVDALGRDWRQADRWFINEQNGRLRD